MLPGRRRIRRPDQFRSVMRSPARAGSSCVVVHVGPLAESGGAQARAGFVVGRSVGGSVVRHRVQRRLRAIAARALPMVPDGLGVVVRALPPAASADYAQLEREVVDALDRGLIRLGQRPRSVVAVSQ